MNFKRLTTLLIAVFMLLSLTTVIAAYPDVPEDYWAAESIYNLSKEKILTGDDQGNYLPEGKIKRSEWAAMLCRIAKIENSIIGSNDCSVDVPINYWAKPSITAVLDIGYMEEDENHFFYPEQPATRFDIVLSLLRYLEVYENDYKNISEKSFSDVSDDYYKAIEYASSIGLVMGYDDGTFRGENTVTRAEAAVFAERAINKKNSLDKLPKSEIKSDGIKVSVNDTPLELEVSPVEKNGTLFLPLKKIVSTIGTRYSFTETSTGAGVSLYKNHNVSIEAGSNIVKISGYEDTVSKISLDSVEYTSSSFSKEITLDTTPEFIDNVLMVPIEVLTDALQLHVSWDKTKNTIDIITELFKNQNERKEFLDKLTCDPTQACDKKGIRITFPVEADYKVIEKVLFDEFGYSDGITFVKGVWGQTTDDSEEVTYLEGRLPLKGDDRKVNFDNVETKEYYEYGVLPYDSKRENSYAFIRVYSDIADNDYSSFIYKDYEYELDDVAYTTLYNYSKVNDIKENIKELKSTTDLYSYSVRDNLEYTLINDIIDYIIEDNMTDIEKIKAVHDFIISNSAYDRYFYDKLFLKDGTPEYERYEGIYHPYDAYGVLIHRKGVCSGFAETFQLFMDRLGINSFEVSGQVANKNEKLIDDSQWETAAYRKQSHGWNIVEIDGNWYHIDVTWDNPANNKVSGNIEYDYFLISNDQMSKLRNWRWGEDYWYVGDEYDLTNELDVSFSRSKTEYQKPLDFWE